MKVSLRVSGVSDGRALIYIDGQRFDFWPLEDVLFRDSAAGKFKATTPYKYKPKWTIHGTVNGIMWEAEYGNVQGFLVRAVISWEKDVPGRFVVTYTITNKTGRTKYDITAGPDFGTSAAPLWTAATGNPDDIAKRVTFQTGNNRGSVMRLIDLDNYRKSKRPWAASAALGKYEYDGAAGTFWGKPAKALDTGNWMQLDRRDGKQVLRITVGRPFGSSANLSTQGMRPRIFCIHKQPVIGTLKNGETGTASMTLEWTGG